jgi:glycosyltransferase involved in cell wall biosynthesis
MKLSIVVPVLNSHEIVRRQALHFKKINEPDGVEIIYVDDGSDPPVKDHGIFKVVKTNDKRDWTWAVARNYGAKISRGDYLLMTDLDYIIPKDAIEKALAFTGDKMRFKREFAILDEDGNFSQTKKDVLKYGLLPERIKERGFQMPPHPNNFCIRKDLFWEMGGYREDKVGNPYPQREDGLFKKKWLQFVKEGKAVDDDARLRSTLYMFPNGQFCGDVDYNPFGLFHKLSRKTDVNPWYKHD